MPRPGWKQAGSGRWTEEDALPVEGHSPYRSRSREPLQRPGIPAFGVLRDTVVKMIGPKPVSLTGQDFPACGNHPLPAARPMIVLTSAAASQCGMCPTSGNR